jgi:hypothetical protein
MRKRRRGTERGRLSYQRVLMAVYWLSDDFVCRATVGEIAAEAGRSVEATKAYLREMDWDRAITILYRRGCMSSREIILMDGPSSREWVDSMRASGMWQTYSDWEAEQRADWEARQRATHGDSGR